MARKTYTGPAIDISFDGEICQHSGICVQGNPRVFEVGRRPWIDLAETTADKDVSALIELVGRCPSGALRVERVAMPTGAANG